MRTTLSLDKDVAAQLERLRKKVDAPFKDIVNEALRLGLREMSAPPQRRSHASNHTIVDVLMSIQI